MNKEVKQIKMNRTILGEKLPNSPERIYSDTLMDVSQNLVESMNRYFEGIKDDNLEVQAKAICENTYYVLNTFADMGIEPDYLLRILLKYKLGRYWDNNSKNLKDNPTDFYDEIRTELEFMHAPNYFGGEANINEDFVKMQDAFQKLGILYSNDPKVLSKNLSHNYYFSNLNALYNYRDGVDIIDDVYNLINMLYNNLYTLAQMGVNPKKYLDEIIEEKMNTKKKRR